MRRYTDDPSVAAMKLREVPIFADLEGTQLDWLRDRARMLRLAPGEALVHEGDAADAMFAVLEGTIRGNVERGTPDGRVYVMGPGTVTGMLPHSRLTHFPVTVRADGPALVACFSAEIFVEMGLRMPALMPRLASVMADRIRANAEQDQLRERLIGLGQLSAGLAHELNNPAAAIQRSVDELGSTVEGLGDLNQGLLERLDGSSPVRIFAGLRRTPSANAVVSDPLERGEAEDVMARWLEDRGVPDAWLAAETFIAAGVTPEQLAAADDLPEDIRPTLLRWLEAHLVTQRLVRDITEASGRISRLVAAVKSYSHMDRAQARSEIDVVEGIEATLTVLGHKLRDRGVRVERAYAPDLPRIRANAGELNQMWTNLVDNAVDASSDGGTVTVRTKAGPRHVTVQVIDAGGGISDEIRQRIFEPFFTTKGVGVGTGLGLDVVQRIVDRHQGVVRVDSEPGRTCFEVQLPIHEPA